MYWEIGKYVSEKVKVNAWGKSIVNEFSNFVQEKYIGIKGFSSQNIWRMKQFYETSASVHVLTKRLLLLPFISYDFKLIIFYFFFILFALCCVRTRKAVETLCRNIFTKIKIS
jgi:hypothetical protein